VEFCDGLEMEFISALGGIQQIGASETAAKPLLLVLVSVTDWKRLETRLLQRLQCTQRLANE